MQLTTKSLKQVQSTNPAMTTKAEESKQLTLEGKRDSRTTFYYSQGLMQFQDDIEQTVNSQADLRFNHGKQADDVESELKELILVQAQQRTNQNSLIFNNQSQLPLTDRESQRKRHLPIQEKGKVFNEWAAVALHQDEIIQQQDIESNLRQKERQQKYKEDLDRLNSLRQQKSYENKLQDITLTEAMIKKDQLSYVEAVQKEELKRKQLESLRKQNEAISGGDYKDKLQRDHQNRLYESQNYKQMYDSVQNELKSKDNADKSSKLNDMNRYKDILEYQIQLKQKKPEDESNLNGQWQSQLMDLNRERFNQLMNGKHDGTEARRNNLSRYIQTNTVDEKGRFYQENQKYEQVNLQKLQDRDFKEQEHRLNTRRNQMAALEKQVGMKTLMKQTDKNEDEYYGQVVRAKAMAEQMQNKAQKEQSKQRQEEYSKTLEQQMNKTNLQKQFDTVMTEHERRVNDADIRAYQNVDQANLYHKIPGYRRYGDEIQDKYLEKNYSQQLQLSETPRNLNNQMSARESNNNSMHFQTLNRNEFTDKTVHQSHLNPQMKFQQSVRGSFDPISVRFSSHNRQPQSQAEQAKNMFQVSENKIKPTYMLINSIPQQLPENKLAQAQVNMEMPETLMFRHNTRNKAYGFDQTLNRQIEQLPTKAANILPDGDFPYKYTVAGNYKSTQQDQKIN